MQRVAALVAEEVPDGRRARIAVIAGPERAEAAAEELRRALADAEVVTPGDVDLGRLGRLHVWLAANGPYDAVVDLVGGKVRRRLRRLLFHARPGAPYVLAFARREPTDAAESWLTALATRGRNARPPRRFRDDRSLAQKHRAALALSLADIGRDGRILTVRHRADVAATVRERDLHTLIALRGRDDDVLLSLPASTAHTAGRVRTSAGDRGALLAEVFEAPSLHLRRWDDVVCHRRQLAVQDRLVLPASFARAGTVHAHAMAAPWAPGFVRPVDEEATPLPGTWFHLDNATRGHFGHAMTEQLSLTWGWRAAAERFPGLGALVSASDDRPPAAWEYDLLGAAGVPADRIHVVRRPVRVDTLLTATPMFLRPAYAHAALVDTYRVVSDALAARATGGPAASRLFLSRRPGNRTCHNAAEVEDLHRAHGFQVVYPEEHPLTEQVRMVRGAEVISGFAGSGMFLTALAGRDKHVIAITSESYPAHNEQMIAAVAGHRLDLVLCRPDVAAGEGFDTRAFHSAFTFDPGREGAFLDEVLRGLG